MENRKVLKRLTGALILVFSAKAQSISDTSWRNLDHTLNRASVTVARRDGRCLTGKIESFDDKSIVIDNSTVERKDILRVADGISLDAHDSIYSGRSSWWDLRQSRPSHHEHIELGLRNDLTQSCQSIIATEEDAACDGRRIAKSDVVRGYYVRLAPATEWERHLGQENVAYLSPRSWFGYAFFPRIKVLLYDATIAQDNTKIACNAR
jgi:small nuclear ribonucleoprotein (snRNP)-like protein